MSDNENQMLSVQDEHTDSAGWHWNKLKMATKFIGLTLKETVEPSQGWMEEKKRVGGLERINGMLYDDICKMSRYDFSR